MSPKTKKKNLFNRAKIEFLKYDEFLDLFAQCSKLVVSEKVKNTAQIINLSPNDDECLYDIDLLLQLRDYFDRVESIDSLAYKIVISGGGETFSDEVKSKRNLAKKRNLLNRILTDVINKSREQYKQVDNRKTNSKKIYTATIKSSMVTYPPNKISNKRFNDYISKADSADRDLLMSIYKQVDQYYCSQGRINKNNFNKVAEIIFKIKHLHHEDK